MKSLISSRLKILFFLVITSFFAMSAPPYTQGQSRAPERWRDIAEMVLDEIGRAGQIFQAGRVDKARDILSNAYFEKFEALGMEMVVKSYISSARAYELERIFGKIRKSMGTGDGDRVRELIGKLGKEILKDAETLDGKEVAVEGAGYSGSKNRTASAVPVSSQTLSDSSSAVSEKRGRISPTAIVKEIEGNMDKALIFYRAGEPGKAKKLVSGSYFESFEGKGLESRIAVRSGKLKSRLESGFSSILGKIEKGAPLMEVEKTVQSLLTDLYNAASAIQEERSAISQFFSSLFIILREGFEAILVISALVAYLHKTENDDKARYVGYGVLVAILSSALTAVLLMTLYSTSGVGRENLEGATMLAAAAVLFYVSYWLTSKAEAARWREYIQKQIVNSIGTGNLISLGLTSFVVVYREGAETILFYSALFANSGEGGSLPVWAGFLCGSVTLSVIYYIFKIGAERIAIRPFFTVTGIILYYMAFVFAGQGIVELQVGGMLHSTPLEWVPVVGILGIYPSLESVGLQATLLVAATFAAINIFLVRPYRARLRYSCENGTPGR